MADEGTTDRQVPARQVKRMRPTQESAKARLQWEQLRRYLRGRPDPFVSALLNATGSTFSLRLAFTDDEEQLEYMEYYKEVSHALFESDAELTEEAADKTGISPGEISMVNTNECSGAQPTGAYFS